jgi:hypothetical protein
VSRSTAMFIMRSFTRSLRSSAMWSSRLTDVGG